MSRNTSQHFLFISGLPIRVSLARVYRGGYIREKVYCCTNGLIIALKQETEIGVAEQDSETILAARDVSTVRTKQERDILKAKAQPPPCHQPHN